MLTNAYHYIYLGGRNMEIKKTWHQIRYLMLSIIAVSFLASCAGAGQTGNQETVKGHETTHDQQLALSYSKIVALPISMSKELTNYYPNVARECQLSVARRLQELDRFQNVTIDDRDQAKSPETLLVKITISDMRIVSPIARAWGPWAGSSFMNLDIVLIDGMTNQVQKSKQILSSNTAFAAGWTMGNTDVSLPTDMGKIVADYIDSILP